MKSINDFKLTFSNALLVDKVSKEDEAQYRLCAELWCKLFLDCAGYAAMASLATAIDTYGMYTCIADADLYAKQVLQEQEINSWDFTLYELWSDLEYQVEVGQGMRLVGKSVHGLEGSSLKAATMQILFRFPKRFTVCHPDTSGSIAKFKAVHNDTCVYGSSQSRWPGMTIRFHIARVMSEILMPKRKSDLKKIARHMDEFRPFFSSGSIFFPELTQFDDEGKIKKDKNGKPLAFTSKVKALKYASLAYTSNILEWFAPFYPFDSSYAGFIPPVVKDPIPKRWSLLMAVPKDFESSRMIAPNTAWLNYYGSWVRELLIQLTTATGFIEMMPPEDQSLNRTRAQLGSLPDVDDPYVTLDLSHASDSIARYFFKDVCPKAVWSIVNSCLETVIFIDGKPYRPGLLASSGHKCTPILQSCLFLAICCTACDLCGEPRDVSVYNDDLICRQSVAQTVIELLEACGFTVNMKKSFTKGLFRESCGGEYCAGYDVTGYYWPRKALPMTKPGTTKGDLGIQSLIALQHKLFYFPTVRITLEREILHLFPDMTKSSVGSDCEDLWTVALSPYESMRRPHYCLRTLKERYNAKDRVLSDYLYVGERWYQQVRYEDFLKYGPKYADDLSQLLSVTEPDDADITVTFGASWRLANQLIVR